MAGAPKRGLRRMATVVPHQERRVDLELVETRTFSSRIAYLRYRVTR